MEIVFHLDFTVHTVGAEGPHSISLSFERWAVCPHLLLSESYNTHTKVKVVSPYEVWKVAGVLVLKIAD